MSLHSWSTARGWMLSSKSGCFRQWSWCFQLRWLLLLGVAVLGTRGAKAANDIVLRTSLRPDGAVLVGQRITWQIDVLGKDGWASVKRKPKIEISGAIVFWPDVQATRINDTIQGASYSGTRIEVWIYPQRSGNIIVPPVKWYAINTVYGAVEQESKKTLQSDAMTIKVAPQVSNSEDSSAFGQIVTDRFGLTQNWSKTPDTIKVGDAIRREVERTADGLPSVLLAPLRFDGQTGVKVIADEPESSNMQNRGELQSRRVDRVTYLFQTPGEYVLPAIECEWFDLNTRTQKTEIAEGKRILVVNAPIEDAGDVAAAQVKGRGGAAGLWLAVSLVFVALVAGFVWFGKAVMPRLRRYVQALFASRAETEAAYFNRFRQACNRGVPIEVLSTLFAWSSRVVPFGQSLHTWLDRLDASNTVVLLNDLECAVNDGAANWGCARQFATEFAGVRRKAIHYTSHRIWQSAADNALPPLR